MGKGRAPCCDKTQVKRGPWSPAEDLRLITFIQKHGHDNWRSLPKQSGLLRCGKSCRLRWINYLRPDVKRGNFTEEEEENIIKLHQSLGNKWSKIASHFPGRTDNEIKNVWNTHLKKRLAFKEANSNGYDSKESTITSSSSSSSCSSFMSGVKRTIEVQPDEQQSKKPREEIKTTFLDNVQDFQVESSHSCLSNNSNPPHIDASKPEEDLDSLFESIGPLHEEVYRPDVSDDAIDIPLDNYSEMWNMLELENLDSYNPNNLVQSHEFGGELNREIENKMWLRNLENELGLEATMDGNQDFRKDSTRDDDQVILDTFQYEILLNPESDLEIDFWPSSPHTFAL